MFINIMLKKYLKKNKYTEIKHDNDISYDEILNFVKITQIKYFNFITCDNLLEFKNNLNNITYKNNYNLFFINTYNELNIHEKKNIKNFYIWNILIIKEIIDVCNICFEKNIVIKTKCNHLFDLQCITKWSIIKNTCPICRQIL